MNRVGAIVMAVACLGSIGCSRQHPVIGKWEGTATWGVLPAKTSVQYWDRNTYSAEWEVDYPDQGTIKILYRGSWTPLSDNELSTSVGQFDLVEAPEAMREQLTRTLKAGVGRMQTAKLEWKSKDEFVASWNNGETSTYRRVR